VDRRALALHDVLEVLDVQGAGLLDRLACRAGEDDLGGHQSAQLGLGLRARQTLGLEAPPADPPGAVPGLPTVAVGSHEEPTGSIRAPRHHDHYVA
jgi:hypothetical protein